MHAYLLAAGQSKRLWPYYQKQSCLTHVVAGHSMLYWWLLNLSTASVTELSIATCHSDQIYTLLTSIQNKHSGLKKIQVHLLPITHTTGPADTLQQLTEGHSKPANQGVVFFADQYLHPQDLTQLLNDKQHHTCLFRPLRAEERADRISFNLNHGFDFIYHPRRQGYQSELCAFYLNQDLSELFSSGLHAIDNYIQCGMMPSDEAYIEPCLAHFFTGKNVNIIECKSPSFNLDYPWNLLEISQYLTEQRCQRLSQNHIPDSSTFSSQAYVNGYVKLGENSHIGAGVHILGNVIIGDHVRIEQGAILEGNNIIGDHCLLTQHCKITAGSTVAERSKLAHCAELNGLLLGNNYLNHQCVINGILGKSVDIGAGTIFGDLRFDDAPVTHNIHGKRVTPTQFSQMVYMGDYCRTGVNVSVMPGVKVGTQSIIGANCCIQQDVESQQLLQLEQSISSKPWGSHRYGV